MGKVIAAVIVCAVAILIEIDLTARYDCTTMHIDKACAQVLRFYADGPGTPLDRRWER